MYRFVRLFEPLKIGLVEIKNRIAMAPIGIGGLTNPNGSPGMRAVEYYLERARGNVGLIITSNFKVENDIDPLPHGFMLVTRGAFAPFAELAEAIHALGAKIFVQLTAGFGRVASPNILRGKPVSASAIPNFWDPGVICKELSVEEIERIVKAFGVGASILAEAGIDGVELHGHEGYLFDQFATSLWNKRNDRYGGDLVGRLRFPIEVLKEIKQKVGQSYPVQYRFGLRHYVKDSNSPALPGEDYVESGRDLQEGLEMARMLEKAGFDSLHVDAGCYESWYWPHPPSYQKHGCMVELAAAVKKVVKIPVIAVGKLDEPRLAEKVIAEGKADMVAIGKGLLADPHWVRKVEQGRLEHIRPCIGCHDGCMGRLVAGKPISCTVNPSCGRERSYGLEPAQQSKKVIVVGGGIAGMEAARVSAIRGHKVVLYEKSDRLGGHVAEASVMPFKVAEGRLLSWYETEMSKLQVDIQMNMEVDATFLSGKKPDAVIVATGSKPAGLHLPGANEERVATAIDLLSGEKQAGERVIVVGGGRVGCETALWLAQQGKRVTILEKLGDLMAAGLPIPRMNRLMLIDLIRFHQVDVLTRASILKITEEGAVISDGSSDRKEIMAETIAIAVGLQPELGLYRSLWGRIPDVYVVGDARKVRNIMGAVWDAYEVARAI